MAGVVQNAKAVHENHGENMVKHCLACGKSDWKAKFNKRGNKGVFECQNCESKYKLIYKKHTPISCLAMLELPGGTRIGHIEPLALVEGRPFDIDNVVPLEGEDA